MLVRFVLMPQKLTEQCDQITASYCFYGIMYQKFQLGRKNFFSDHILRYLKVKSDPFFFLQTQTGTSEGTLVIFIIGIGVGRV